MDIGYRRYVTQYIDFLENMGNIIDVSLHNNIDLSIDELINSVLSYVHENFPALLIAKEEILERIKSIYKQKTENFKKDVEFRTASTKYDLSGTYSINKIKEYMEKGNKDIIICFKSVSFGTNVSYKDTVTNISSELFGIIQRKSNNNLIFAKKTRETQEFIENETLKYYIKFMNNFGNELLEKGVNPLQLFLESVSNYEETSNRDIIEEYKHTIAA